MSHYDDSDRAMARAEAAWLREPEPTERCARCRATVDAEALDAEGHCGDCAADVADDLGGAA